MLLLLLGSPNIHVVAETEQKQEMERWEIFGKGITCLMPLLLLGPTSTHVEYFGEKEWDEKRWKLGYNQRLHRCFVHRTPKANSMHCIYGSRDSFLIIIKTPWNSTATVTIISGSKYSMTVFREMKMLCSRTFTYSDFYSFSQKFWQLKFDGSDIKKTEYISAQPFSTQVSSLISL